MKVLAIAILTFLLPSSQEQKIDKTFYLLGTLSDYMGLGFSKDNPSNEDFIMSLHQAQWGEIKRIEEVTGTSFERRQQDNCSNCHEFYSLKSLSIANNINSFYFFDKSDYEAFDGEGYPLWTKKLRCELLLNASEAEQLSFLAGQFLTCGSKESGKYKISLANSLHRFHCIKKLLELLNSKIVHEEITVGSIPTGYYLTFDPSDKLQTMIEYEISRRNALAGSNQDKF